MSNSHITIRDSWPLVDGIPIPYFNALRDAKSRLAAYNATRVARPKGKIAFAEFVERNGGRVPRTIAMLADGRVESPESITGKPVRKFLEQLPHGHYFCKLVEQFSPERIVMTIAGTKPCVESALTIARRNASRLKITDIAAAPSPEAVPPA